MLRRLFSLELCDVGGALIIGSLFCQKVDNH